MKGRIKDKGGVRREGWKGGVEERSAREKCKRGTKGRHKGRHKKKERNKKSQKEEVKEKEQSEGPKSNPHLKQYRKHIPSPISTYHSNSHSTSNLHTQSHKQVKSKFVIISFFFSRAPIELKSNILYSTNPILVSFLTISRPAAFNHFKSPPFFP